MQQYVNGISRISKTILSDSSKELIDSLSDQIIYSVKSYYKGYASESFEELSKGINQIKSNLTLSKRLDFMPLDVVQNLYRVRSSQEKIFSRKEMFHIPFEQRGNVKEQRYSIIGLPCLYLANSSYLAWLELGKPDFSNLQVSRLQLNLNELSFLDISVTPKSHIQYFKEYLDKGDSLMEEKFIQGANRIFILWPLVMACSINVKKPNSNFIPEYIIPKQLLEWVRIQNEVDGIRYFSTKIEEGFNFSSGNLINYVIPVQTSEEKGVCRELSKKIRITNPISWNLLNMATEDVYQNMKTDKRGYKEHGNNLPLNKVEIIKGVKQDYWKTAFGKVEYQLLQMEEASIK